MHLAACPACTTFAARQQSVDVAAQQDAGAAELSPGFRKALRKRIRREAMQLSADSLPDKVHFLSCGFATVMCAILMQFHPGGSFQRRRGRYVATYVLMTAVRNLFEAPRSRVSSSAQNWGITPPARHR